METVVETERLVLRRLGPADIDELLVLHNDPDVMRFLDGGTPKSRADIEREYHDRLLPYDYLAGIEKATGSFVGWYSLHVARGAGRDDAPGDYWLGYRLHKRYWGRGYATEGVRALIHDGFTTRGVLRVRATTMAVNTRSRQVMERCGLTYVRTFHEEWDDPLPGTEHGEVEYALTKSEWEHTR